MKRYAIFAAGVGAVTGLAAWAGLDGRQLAATAIFAALILSTLLFWTYRLAFAFIALCLLLAFGLLDIPHFIEYAHLDIIMFLVAMMTVVGFLEERRFFERVVEGILFRKKPSAMRFCILVMLLGAVSAALVDEVTSILFMTAVVLHFVTRLGVNPLPFVMMLVFATNIGSAATVVGNPVGVMVALKGGLSFGDFLRWASPIAIVGLIVALPLSLWWFRREIRELQAKIDAGGGAGDARGAPEASKIAPEAAGHAGEAALPPQRLWPSMLIFIGLIGGLVLHSPLEKLLGLDKNTMLIGTAMGFAGLVLLLDPSRAREIVERRVDWWTLSFFLTLFASVGTLKHVGVTNELARLLVGASGESTTGLLLVLTWGGGFLSATMDNVLAVATLIPIVQDLQGQGMDVFPLWWGLLFAGTFFGNVTMIGSTANIIAVGILERRGWGLVDFWTWLKPGAIIGIVTLGLATLLVWLQLPWMRGLG